MVPADRNEPEQNQGHDHATSEYLKTMAIAGLAQRGRTAAKAQTAAQTSCGHGACMALV